MKKEVKCPACGATLAQHELKQFLNPKIPIRRVLPCPLCHVPLKWSSLPLTIDFMLYLFLIFICIFYATGSFDSLLYVLLLLPVMLGFLTSSWLWKLERAKPGK